MNPRVLQNYHILVTSWQSELRRSPRALKRHAAARLASVRLNITACRPVGGGGQRNFERSTECPTDRRRGDLGGKRPNFLRQIWSRIVDADRRSVEIHPDIVIDAELVGTVKRQCFCVGLRNHCESESGNCRFPDKILPDHLPSFQPSARRVI
jgi:hypothetical protein